jgi:beta-galactosidase/beta-glucuronidase
MKKLIILLSTIILLSQCIKPDFQKSDILVTGTAEPLIDLNGTWKFTTDPPKNFFSNEVSYSDWKDILVPGDYAEHGFVVRPDNQCVYKTSIVVPSDYAGKIIMLRFNNIRSSARVWVNGTLVCDHSGDTTRWDCDITKYVEPGTNTCFTVELTDKYNEIALPVEDTMHQTGCNIRSVSLLALPENYPKAILVKTQFDSKNKDADLNIRIVPVKDFKTWVSFRMYDPKGKQIRLNDRRYLIREDTMEISFPIKTPLKWDAEHPNLYSLITEVFNKSILTASIKTEISFREGVVKSNKRRRNK